MTYHPSGSGSFKNPNPPRQSCRMKYEFGIVRCIYKFSCQLLTLTCVLKIFQLKIHMEQFGLAGFRSPKGFNHSMCLKMLAEKVNGRRKRNVFFLNNYAISPSCGIFKFIIMRWLAAFAAPPPTLIFCHFHF